MTMIVIVPESFRECYSSVSQQEGLPWNGEATVRAVRAGSVSNRLFSILFLIR